MEARRRHRSQCGGPGRRCAAGGILVKRFHLSLGEVKTMTNSSFLVRL